MTSFIPAARSLEVSTPRVVRDRFNDEVTVHGDYQPAPVVGWAVSRVEETGGDSVLRTIDQLDIYTPAPLDPACRVRLPDGSVWQVRGHAEDYRHGPWWDPGLVVVHAVRVEG